MIEETKNILDENGLEIGNIPCHHTLPYSHPPQGKSAVCRGWWDHAGKNTWWGRLARIMDVLVWWDEPASQ